MKKRIQIYLLLLFLSHALYAQEDKKWVSEVNVNYAFPSKVTYSGQYYENGEWGLAFDENLKEYPYFFLDYNMDYKLFKFLSLYGVTGFNTYTKYKFSFWKLGGGFKFYFFNSQTTYFNLSLSGLVSLNKTNAEGGENINLGINFRMFQIDEKSIILKIMYDYSSAKTKKDFLNDEFGSNVVSKYVDFRSFSLGAGIRF